MSNESRTSEKIKRELDLDLPVPSKENRSQRAEATKKKMIKKFLFVVGTTVGAFLIIGGIAVFAFMKSTEADKNTFHVYDSPIPNETDAGVTSAPPSPSPMNNFLLPPEKTNFIIVGEDINELLTDVILVGCFDRDSLSINVVSVPRDTKVVLPQARIQRMQEYGLHPPYDGIMKMNAVHSYGGKKYGMILLQEQLSDLFDIEIDYYVEVNLEAFRNIVDLLGGVDMEIPKGGMYYRDPYQKLEIAVPGGMQHLDGAMAEGVVRFRATYRNGDLDRINVQQEFMRLLFEQALNKNNLRSNAVAIGTELLKNVQTNFSLTDAPKYFQYITELKGSHLQFFTLPSYSDDSSGTSYVVVKENELEDLVREHFLAKGIPAPYSSANAQDLPALTVTPANSVSSKTLAIEILNGAQKAGIAAAYKEKLEKAGFKIAHVDNYSGTLEDETRIYVKNSGVGIDLTPYFSNAVVSVRSGIPEPYDIIIIIGKSEAEL